MVVLVFTFNISCADDKFSRKRLDQDVLQRSRKILPSTSYEEIIKRAANTINSIRLPHSNPKRFPSSSNASDYGGINNENMDLALNYLQTWLTPSVIIGTELPKRKEQMNRDGQGTNQPVQVSDFATCMTDLVTISTRFKGGAKWAVQMFDAWGKPGSGVVQGNTFFLGGFDECVQTDTKDVTFNSQYCLQYMGVTRIGSLNFSKPITFVEGTCVPSTCTAEDIKNIINVYLYTEPNITAGSGGGRCYNPHLPLSNKAIAVIIVCSIFAFLMVTGTLYDILIVHENWRLLVPKAAKLVGQTDGEADPGTGENQPLLSAQHLSRKEFEPTNTINYLEQAYKRWTFQALMNASVSVDTFFTIRLTPPYMLVLMVYVPLFHYINDGPMWPQTSIEPGECESNWWSNFLYINNLHKFGGKPMCMAWSWYLANDMQFYIISPAIFLIMFYYGWWGLVLPSLLILGSAITAGVLSSQNDLFANFDLLKTQSDGDYNDIYYVKPYCRIGPYLVGMITGYLLYRTDCNVRMSRCLRNFEVKHCAFIQIRSLYAKLTNCVGWAIAWAVGLATVYGLYENTDGHPVSSEVAALYNAMARIAWGAAVSWVIFACATGYGGKNALFRAILLS
ncbi:nose resistant to fluoxetine protein 6-like [Plakobranchus ocellatus]|uniref:Nose resistant to fluoxetine protein 6-like n=1 Tax=Plakobranchus ocellatus TaxID=259542 RepID=A0AAV3ZX49_9GAST|nr:nose resistant to fluoxetine protein 6-like [Plakobranchus ocellatus]